MMHDQPFLFIVFLIFTGAALVATLFLYLRQALLVAYILLGMALGPFGLALVTDPVLISRLSDIGIVFLLFLLGLNLPIPKLLQLVRETTLVTGLSALVFGLIGVIVARGFGFTLTEQLVTGAAMMFSSTIIGLKLLPTTILHHQHTGQIIISILLLQDLLAIGVLLLIQLLGGAGLSGWHMLGVVLGLPLLFGLGYVAERYVLVRLIRRYDTIQEYIFLMAIGWCVGFAQLAASLGLSYEIGAFLAGVALATSPIALYIAESLKPLRDFFLVMFFFSLGAGFDLGSLPQVLAPALVLAGASLLVKPWLFHLLLVRSGEDPGCATEVGVRLAQISEFSLLISVLALNRGLIGHDASYVIQTATILTFLVSSYYTVLRYPTPIAVSDRLRRD